MKVYKVVIHKRSNVLTINFVENENKTYFIPSQKKILLQLIVEGFVYSGRSVADSNRRTRFCRPLPNHSANRPEYGFLPFWAGKDNKILFEPTRKT